MLLLDQISLAAVAQYAQLALDSVGVSVVAAFAVVGVGLSKWSQAQSAALLSRTLRRKPGVATQRTAAQPAAERLVLSEQFDRSIAIVEAARSRTALATSLQHSAREKLDAADYALHRLLDELSDVMATIEKPAFANTVNRPLEVVGEPDVGLAA